MHGAEIFTQLSIVIVLVTIVSLIAHAAKQPLILGYIMTGIIIGTIVPLLPFTIEIHTETFETFSSLGIALLLFIIGLGLSVSVFRRLGRVSITTALSVLIVLGSIGYALSQGFGFTQTESVLVGLALFFSSTIIIVKVLSDKNEQTRLHGQIAIGVILIDDMVATIALLFVAAGKNGFGAPELGLLFIKGIILALALTFTSMKILPKLTRLFAHNQELLFLFTIAWGFGVASIFQWVGFSIEVGALFAGVSLAALPYSQEMAARLKPLRDFFIVLFFIGLGARLQIDNLASGLGIALILSGVVMVIKPLTVMFALNLFGYTKRTSFKAAINLSQISEFSIILIAVANASKLVDDQLAAVVTIVAITTIAVSTYLMQYDNVIFGKLERRFRFFRESVNREEEKTAHIHDIILFGYRKGGHEFVKTFKQMRKKYIVVDYNPTVIESLERQHLPFIYGDATDLELLREIGVKQAKLIVSTVTDFSTNEQIIRYIHRVNPHAVIVCHADNYEQATLLYRHGATYVMLPHYIGSERISAFIRKHGTNHKAFNEYRQKHLLNLGRTALK
jgi:Kef-type K+ transport system membrane component KefB